MSVKGVELLLVFAQVYQSLGIDKLAVSTLSCIWLILNAIETITLLIIKLQNYEKSFLFTNPFFIICFV